MIPADGDTHMVQVGFNIPVVVMAQVPKLHTVT
jgi:hypothetical protein